MRNIGKVFWGLLAPCVLMVIWLLCSHRHWISDQILPGPALVGQTLAVYIRNGDLLSDTLVSLRRVAEGFAIGALLGTIFGITIGLSVKVRPYVEPVFLALTQVPVFGWAPLVIVILGIDESFKVSLIAWAAFIPAVLNAAQGVRNVPIAYRELGQVYRLGRWSTFRVIVLPAALPAIFVGTREALANSWQTLVAAELLASSEGLGYLMSWGRQLFQLEVVITAMIVIGLIGISFNLLFRLLEKRFQPWKAALS